MKYNNILEEEIKNKVTINFLNKFDCTKILGKIDFAVRLKRPDNSIDFNDEYLLWAEAKQKSADIIAMLAQLVLTIGKARTFDEIMPPKFLGCFDCEKIVFIPYHDIQDIFYQNDFNWNVAPSNHDTREFKQIYEKIKNIVENDIPFETYLFDFEKDEKELKRFIKENFNVDKSDITKIKIDKNNFINIYQKWNETVKPKIAVKWDKTKARGIIDGDFYLADLLSAENKTLKEKLFVLLHGNYYEFDRIVDEDDIYNSKRAEFSDNQKAHTQFWAKYERPPIEDYWDYIVDHRHLLVPQDIRERKGSFYTPRIWVEKSQEYLAKVFGEDWQDEYYVWDCAAGTGNLLAGLVNKDRIFASTLDKQDVGIMHDRIDHGANLWVEQVFQFDFLNDDFLPKSKGGKLPDELYNIISDENKRKKLIIYINPPYVEGDNKIGKGRQNVHVSKTHDKYQNILGKASGELFAQFFIRIYKEIDGCMLAEFSTLKHLQAPNFIKFRNEFLAKLEKMFIVPADTFDNVKGQFPIGFMIWNISKKEKIQSITTDIYDTNNKYTGKKKIVNYDGKKYISEWLEKNTPNNINNQPFGHLASVGNDFQHQKDVYIDDTDRKKIAGGRHTLIYLENFIICCIYFAVRKVIPDTWLNDRDQFLYPNKNWEKDLEFHNDCLTYTLFFNNIQSKYGKNHWIPFSETEIGLKHKFESHFMYDFINGTLKQNGYNSLFQQQEKTILKREFSIEAQAVFDAGRELWKYYHTSQNLLSFKNLTGLEYNVNASLYDIREYFQGRNDKGKMNSKSEDEKYNELIGALRESLDILAKKIEPKVYEYEFLKK
jgi:hypothetical protein